MSHILIISGGQLKIEFARRYIETLSYDKVFVVDKGLEYADSLGVTPDYIVGDFDTVSQTILGNYQERIERGELDTELDRYPAKKDATDTELALIRAIEEKPEKITILGGTGSRLDHVLANVNILQQAEEAGISCYLTDETNRIRLLTDRGNPSYTLERENQHGTYLSLIPLTDTVSGVTLEGVAYPLTKQTIARKSSLTVSNEIVAERAYLTFERGLLLVIESKD